MKAAIDDFLRGRPLLLAAALRYYTSLSLMPQTGDHHGSVLSTLIGTIVGVLGAISVFGQLQTALNAIWRVEAIPRKDVIWKLLGSRLRALGIVLALAFLLMMSMLMSAAPAMLHDRITDLFPGAVILVRVFHTLISFALVSAVIALLFKYVPDVIIRWRETLCFGEPVQSTHPRIGCGKTILREAISRPDRRSPVCPGCRARPNAACRPAQ